MGASHQNHHNYAHYQHQQPQHPHQQHQPASSSTEPAPSSAMSHPRPRQPKPFIMEEQTRFLYLILKQLDLKSVNWQTVADDLGIKNGHAARMRWSRFKGHVEGVPANSGRKRGHGQRENDGGGKHNASGNNENNGIGMGISLGKGAGLKRYADHMADDDEVKRVKMEQQGWPIQMHGHGHGGYGHGLPPGSYFANSMSYGVPLAQHPSFGPPPTPGAYHQPPPPSHNGQAQYTVRPHSQSNFQQQSSRQLLPVVLPLSPGKIDPAAIRGPTPASGAMVKPEPNPEQAQPTLPSTTDRAENAQVSVKPEPAAEPKPKLATDASRQTIINTEFSANNRDQTCQPKEEPQILTTDGASVSTTRNPFQPSLSTPQVPTSTLFEDVGAPLGTSTSQNATSAPLNNVSNSDLTPVKTDIPSDDIVITEVSKEEFAKAVDAEAANQRVKSEKQSSASAPVSPEIPRPDIRGKGINHYAASAPKGVVVTAQVMKDSGAVDQLKPSITSGIVARVTSSHAPSSLQSPMMPFSVPKPNAKVSVDSSQQHKTPTHASLNKLPSVSSAPPSTSQTPTSRPAAQPPHPTSHPPFHPNAPPPFLQHPCPPSLYGPPQYSDYQPAHFSYHQRPAYSPPHPYWHTTNPDIKNPPPMSAPPFGTSGWPANTHSLYFGSLHPYSQTPDAMPTREPHSAPAQAISFGEIWTPSNPPPSTPISDQDIGKFDMFGLAGDEFDLTGFEFDVDLSTDTGMEMLDTSDPVMDCDFSVMGGKSQVGTLTMTSVTEGVDSGGSGDEQTMLCEMKESAKGAARTEEAKSKTNEKESEGKQGKERHEEESNADVGAVMS